MDVLQWVLFLAPIPVLVWRFVRGWDSPHHLAQFAVAILALIVGGQMIGNETGAARVLLPVGGCLYFTLLYAGFRHRPTWAATTAGVSPVARISIWLSVFAILVGAVVTIYLWQEGFPPWIRYLSLAVVGASFVGLLVAVGWLQRLHR